MRKSTVTSLRTRLREYENDVSQVVREAQLRFVNPRGDESDIVFDQRRKEWTDGRQLKLRCNFLEDTLKMYQGELQFHVGEEKRNRKDFEKDVIKEMEVLDETNRAVMRQLRQSQVEVESMQDVQEEMHSKTATHFERLLTRQKERHENEKRVLENENTSLQLRVSQLEAALANWKQLEETEAATEANDAHYKISMLREEVKEKNLEVKRAVQHQHKLEESLAQCRGQLHLVLDFIDGCGGSAQRVEMTVRQVAREHHRLVNRLLNVAHEDTAKQFSPSRKNDGYDDEGNNLLDGGDDDGGEILVESFDEQGRRILVPHQRNSSGATTAATTTADRATNEVVRLQKAVDRICQVIHDQHVELALSIDAAATVWETERRELDMKHRETLSHAQTLQTRIQVVERQSAAAQEEAMAERDRALQLRDQAIVFLRAKDVKEHRQPMRHADTQTNFTGNNHQHYNGNNQNQNNNSNNNNNNGNTNNSTASGVFSDDGHNNNNNGANNNAGNHQHHGGNSEHDDFSNDPHEHSANPQHGRR